MGIQVRRGVKTHFVWGRIVFVESIEAIMALTESVTEGANPVE